MTSEMINFTGENIRKLRLITRFWPVFMGARGLREMFDLVLYVPVNNFSVMWGLHEMNTKILIRYPITKLHVCTGLE